MLVSAAPNFNISIFTKNGNSSSLNVVKKCIKQAYPHCTASVMNTTSTEPMLHDRHIYIDGYFQIDFSAGMDSLQPNGSTEIQILSENKISVYSIGESQNRTKFWGLDANNTSQHRVVRSE
jgi:hypothetical protein